MTARSAHGTRSRYQAGCRCDDCRAAQAAYGRARAAEKRDSRLCACTCGLVVPQDPTRRGYRRYLDGHQPGWVSRARPTPEVYLEQLHEISEQLVAAVHDDLDELPIHLRRALRLPHPEDIDPVVALVVALAVQVDPDAPRSQRVGWVEALAGNARRAG